MNVRLCITGLVIVIVLAVTGQPAAADKPERFEDSVTFVDLNPCSGAEHEVTIIFDVALHRHDGRAVVNVKRSGTTSDGFEMRPGSREHVTNNGNWVVASFRDKWSNGDGESFRAQGRIKIDLDTDEVVRDDFDLFCTS